MADVMHPIDEKAIFLVAVELDPEDRDPFLSGACPEPEFRDRIERLIQMHERGLERALRPVGASEGVGSRFGEFELLRELGRGGVGVVHLAWDSVLHREVAVKVLGNHVRVSAEAMRELRDEARLGAAIRHPGVVPVYRFGTQGDTCYIVSEYVEGQTLRARIDEVRASGERPSDWVSWCARTAASVADALDHCHRSGVIHRDLKPSNILLDTAAGPRITDFGIASSQQMVRDGVMLAGSCHYLCPERISDPTSRPDPRSDVFALGVTLYEMLTLEKPFDGKTEEVLRSIVANEAPDPRRVRRELPPDLATICLTCMARDPSRRYQTSAHVAADLRCFLDRRPIIARPATLRYRFTRWTQRNRRLVATAAVASTFAVALTIAYEVRREYRSSVAWISVESAEPSIAYIEPYDPTRLEPASPENIGRVPLRRLSLPKGQYRLSLVRERDGALAEIDLQLSQLGWSARKLVIEDGVAAGRSEGSSTLRFNFAPPSHFDGMVAVEGGVYDLSWGNSRKPWHRPMVEVEPFYIDRFEVTNGQYRDYVLATNAPEPVSWRYIGDFAKVEDRPVIGIRVEDATGYARWAGKRLPTATEWQAAARGKAGRPFPSDTKPSTDGSVREPARPTYEQMIESYVRRVHPARQPANWDNPFGVLNTFANVREFTSSIVVGSSEVIVMGAAWSDPLDEMTLADDTVMPVSGSSARLGFRCARSIAAPEVLTD